ncbi:hypothetical protein [Alkalihalobacillus sp. CinArs1]|uniref:hypothetical protein n=1 Tax=Alkalihalobacillus sp. CinArs1 TaxID=2995314 RepID=UPI0022DD7E85|nr:hypothetical protein [Alkalihalobacillus sp. CinArs1]
MKKALKTYRHVLIISDHVHRERAKCKQRELQNRDRFVQLKVISQLGDGTVEALLSEQPIGSALILCGEGALETERVAVSLGYARNDIYIETQQQMRAFCSQCHHITSLVTHERFVCENCRNQLEPSEHYSSYHRAHLAYPVFIESDD